MAKGRGGGKGTAVEEEPAAVEVEPEAAPVEETPGGDEEAGRVFDEQKKAKGKGAAETVPPEKPADEEAAPTLPPKEEPKPAEVAPAVPPAAPDTALAQREQTLTAREQEVNQLAQQVNAVLQNPLFQQAYQAASQGQGAGAPGQPGQDPNQPPTDPMADFKAETPNEEAMLAAFQGQNTRIDGLIQGVQQIAGSLQGLTSANERQMNQQIDQNLAGVFAEMKGTPEAPGAYADLIDGGEKQDQLEQCASTFIAGAAQAGEALPLPQALDMAAAYITRPQVEERARQAVQAEAARAAGVAVETPDRSVAPESQDHDAMAGDAFDNFAARQ